MAREVIGMRSFLFLCLCIMPILSLCPTPSTNLTKQFIRQHNFSNATTLDFSSCNLESIEDGAFVGSDAVSVLHLKSNNLTQISRSTFMGLTNVKNVYLANNKISHVEDGAFQFVINLRILDLTHNNLTSIKRAMFSGRNMSLAIITLHLNNNDISHIEDDSFSDLSSLQLLYLDNNPLHKIDSNIFTGLVALSLLSLGNCRVTYLAEGSLERLDNLRHLYLHNNHITWLPDTIQHFMCEFQRYIMSDNYGIDLSGNPLQCNCDLNTILMCLTSNPTSFALSFGSVPCLSEPYIPVKALTCNSPTVPVIQYFLSAEQNTVILECESTGDPVPSLTWTTPNFTSIVHPPPYNHSILINTARLVITKDKETVYGKYVCNASSRADWLASPYWLTSTTILPTKMTSSETVPKTTKTLATITSSTSESATPRTTSNETDPKTNITSAATSGSDFLHDVVWNTFGIVIGASVACVIIIAVIVVGGIYFYRLKKYEKMQLPMLRFSKLKTDSDVQEYI